MLYFLCKVDGKCPISGKISFDFMENTIYNVRQSPFLGLIMGVVEQGYRDDNGDKKLY